MQTQNTPIHGMPVICGRRVHLFSLYLTVMEAGGSSKLNQTNGWPFIASSLGFTTPEDSNAPLELAQSFMNLLYPFEKYLKTRQAQQRIATQAMQPHVSNDLSRHGSPQTIPSPATSFRSRSSQPNHPEIGLDPQYQKFAKEQQAPRQMHMPQEHTGQVVPMVLPINAASPQHANIQSPSPVLNNKTPGLQHQHPHQSPVAITSRNTSRNQTPDISRSPSVSSQPPHSRSGSISVNGNKSASIVRSKTNPEMPPPRQIVASPGIIRKPSDVSATSHSPAPASKPLVRLSKMHERYLPKKRKLEFDGGYNIRELARIGSDVDTLAPDFPLFQELGMVEINAVIMALLSMIPGEVRQALDKLALLSSNPAVPIILQECPGLVTALATVGQDLLNNLKSGKKVNTVDVLPGNAPGDEPIDYESEKDLISSVFNTYRHWDERNDDVVVHVSSLTGEPTKSAFEDQDASDALDSVIAADDADFDKYMYLPEPKFNTLAEGVRFGFTHYEELLSGSKDEVESLRSERKSHTSTFWQEALADRLMCVTLILRNISFTDTNQPSMIQDSATLELLFGMTRSLATRPNLMVSKRRKLSLQKDLLTLFANLGLYIAIPSPADAFSVLLLILSFSPEESPYRKNSTGGGKTELMFAEYSPEIHRYLGCAVDALAKLILRDPPNRGYFEEVLLNICTDEQYLMMLNSHLQGRFLRPYEFLTRTFALAISAVPRSDYRVIPKALEIRKPLLHQSLLVAETLATIIPRYEAHDEIITGMSSPHICPDLYAPRYHDTLTVQRDYNVALEWLEASEGFGPSLLRAACALDAIFSPQFVRPGGEVNPFSKITQRSIGILETLGRKAMAFEIDSFSTGSSGSVCSNSSSISMTPTLVDTSMKSALSKIGSRRALARLRLPSKVLPTIEAILGAMLSPNMNPAVVRMLCEFSEEGINFVAARRKKEQDDKQREMNNKKRRDAYKLQQEKIPKKRIDLELDDGYNFQISEPTTTGKFQLER